MNLKLKISFERKIILYALFIIFIPLIISYAIFIKDKLSYIDDRVKLNLKETAFSISETPFIQEKLYHKENDMLIQKYTKSFIKTLDNVDMIVVADMTGEKYSHLDEFQVGKIFINEDKKKVLNEGESYYSVMEGSMGKTL